MTAAVFNSMLYVRCSLCMNPFAPSFSYMFIHPFIVSLSVPTLRAASVMLILALKYSRTIWIFFSALNFCLFGIIMLPLCLTVFFCFTVSHRGSISKGKRGPFFKTVHAEYAWTDAERAFAFLADIVVKLYCSKNGQITAGFPGGTGPARGRLRARFRRERGKE